jgi:hypothetical protein
MRSETGQGARLVQRISRTIALAAIGIGLAGVPSHAAERYGLGAPASEADIARLDIDVRPDGRGLPDGHGSVAEGARLFAERCEGCHQAGGTKPAAPGFDVLVGGQGTFGTGKPVRTIGTYWPYATTLFDYIQRAMPFAEPRSLKPDETYAVVAYLLQANGIVPEGTTLDRASLPKVVMPFRDGYIDRDDWRTPAQPKAGP